jgi:hypothetical protein
MVHMQLQPYVPQPSHRMQIHDENADFQLASLTLTRYGISGLVIMAYPTMYQSLGPEWAGSYVFLFKPSSPTL